MIFDSIKRLLVSLFVEFADKSGPDKKPVGDFNWKELSYVVLVFVFQNVN